MAKYVVKMAGFLDGKFRREGEVVEYNDRQAKYLLMAGSIAPQATAPKKKG
jgi:hypothetical protein